MSQDITPRINDVLELIKSESSIYVTDLSRKLGISESTARRALTTLEKNHLVKRYRGGAAIVRDSKLEPPIHKRQLVSLEQKQAIGRMAAAHTKEGDRIILTGGSTVAAICEYLIGIPNLTIITDSLPVLCKLMYEESMNIISLGGLLNVEQQCFEGFVASSNIKLFRADRIYIGIKGITAQHGFMTDDIRQVDFYRGCASHADELIILADYTKFYQEGLTSLFMPSEVDLLITDEDAPKDVLQKMEDIDCKIEIAQAH